MKRGTRIPIFNRCAISSFQNLKPLLSLSPRSYLSTLLSLQSEDLDQFSGVIQNNDLLKRAPNGNLLVLDHIDRGAMEPDARLYVKLFKKCTYQGKLKEGKKIHTHFLTSRFQHYVVIRNMVINMYAKCGDMELARRAFDEMTERDMVSYTMLITGSSDAARVRKMMNESGVKKEPACSWVEIGNAVHVFVANDDSHPQTEEIRKMWNKLRDGITKIGYVPDTSHALWFVDQEERNERLQNHCEKLALSFAILNVPVGTPITIKKNIRVCGDCHASFKFVSKLIDREIILRDTNRFHHFCGGSCSCNDYW
ncbi:hypothetical protein ACS0TY_004822 [Phlomoides rotata]